MPFSRLGFRILASLFLLTGTTVLTAADSVLEKPYEKEGEVTLGSPVELAVALNEVFGYSWDLEKVKTENLHVCDSAGAIPGLLGQQPNQDLCWLCVSPQRAAKRLPAPQPTDLIHEPSCCPNEDKAGSDCEQEYCPCELYGDVEPVSSESVSYVEPSNEPRYENRDQHRLQEKELEIQWKAEAMEAVLEARGEVFQAQLEAMEELMNLKAESLQNAAKLKEEAFEAVLAAREESFQIKLEGQKQLIESQSQVLRMQATIVSLQQKIELLERQLESKKISPTIELQSR